VIGSAWRAGRKGAAAELASAGRDSTYVDKPLRIDRPGRVSLERGESSMARTSKIARRLLAVGVLAGLFSPGRWSPRDQPAQRTTPVVYAAHA